MGAVDVVTAVVATKGLLVKNVVIPALAQRSSRSSFRPSSHDGRIDRSEFAQSASVCSPMRVDVISN